MGIYNWIQEKSGALKSWVVGKIKAAGSAVQAKISSGINYLRNLPVRAATAVLDSIKSLLMVPVNAANYIMNLPVRAANYIMNLPVRAANYIMSLPGRAANYIMNLPVRAAKAVWNSIKSLLMVPVNAAKYYAGVLLSGLMYMVTLPLRASAAANVIYYSPELIRSVTHGGINLYDNISNFNATNLWVNGSPYYQPESNSYFAFLPQNPIRDTAIYTCSYLLAGYAAYSIMMPHGYKGSWLESVVDKCLGRPKLTPEEGAVLTFSKTFRADGTLNQPYIDELRAKHNAYMNRFRFF